VCAAQRDALRGCGAQPDRPVGLQGNFGHKPSPMPRNNFETISLSVADIDGVFAIQLRSIALGLPRSPPRGRFVFLRVKFGRLCVQLPTARPASKNPVLRARQSQVRSFIIKRRTGRRARYHCQSYGPKRSSSCASLSRSTTGSRARTSCGFSWQSVLDVFSIFFLLKIAADALFAHDSGHLGSIR